MKLQEQNDKNSAVIPFWWDDSKQWTSIRAPRHLKEQLTYLLKMINKKTGVKFSRNEFIIKAIRHYLIFLSELPSLKKMLSSIEDKNSGKE